MNDLKKYADIAWEILNNETPYLRDKKVIQDFFKNPNLKFEQDSIITQLTIIDSYYSTNLSKRYYGKEDIAKKMCSIAKGFEELRQLFENFAINPENDYIITLFKDKYGISKTGEDFGQAISIISKYAYFLTEGNFPIFDSIVCEVYPLIMRKSISQNNIVPFITSMNELSQKSNINNYDKLDNLLWLIGKIRRGNYSLILNKKNYKELIKPVFSDKTGDEKKSKSSDLDKLIKNEVEKSYEKLSGIFSENLIDFIKFSLSFEEKGRK
jgi:hypothetical protein